MVAEPEPTAETQGIEGLEQESEFDASAVEDVPKMNVEGATEDESVGEVEAEDVSFLSLDTADQMVRPTGEQDIPDLDLQEAVSDDSDSNEEFIIRTSTEDIRLGRPEDSFGSLPVLEVDSHAEPSLEPQPADTAPVVIDRVAELEARVAADAEDAQLRREFAEALIESGDRQRGLDELDVALQRFEVLKDWVHAVAVTEEVLQLEPNSLTHHQKRVEYAYRLGEKQQLVQAYLDLGNAFFRSGSVERAQAIYERVLEHDANNVQASDALANLTPAEVPPVIEPVQPAVPESRKSDAYVDLGEFIMGEASERDTRMRVEHSVPTGDEQQDFADMLQQFKRGIEENLDDEDSQAHYDLGVAFKEMGLLDEAIGEFQKALRGTDTRLQSAEMLGLCFIENEQYEVAATVLRRAIEIASRTEQDKINVLYWLGRCEEKKSRLPEALTYYRRVLAVDIHFQDVGQRISSLKSSGS